VHEQWHRNTPKRFWHFAIAHVAYIHNVTSPSRLDNSKTISNLLFSKRADLTQVPPFGCFASTYKNRLTLQDQHPSDQGVFISIAKPNSVIGCCVSDRSRFIVTRQDADFDPHVYPFHEKPLSTPAWQTFHNLTQAAAQSSTHQATPPTKKKSALEYALQNQISTTPLV